LNPTHKNKPYCTDKNWHGHADCRHCAIRGTVLFSVLTESELEEALLKVDNQWHDPGYVLFSQGARAENVYTMRSGCVKMVHELGGGSGMRIVRMHYPGDAIGLEAPEPILDSSRAARDPWHGLIFSRPETMIGDK